MPFFRWNGDQAAVCWVPVDSVTKECGAMRYIKGSHRWPQYAPRLLVSNSPVDDDAADYSPLLPENDELFETEEILSWDCEPGDVIVHNWRTIHGSFGNLSATQTRRAASIRYAGDGVSFERKRTSPENFKNLVELEDGQLLHLDPAGRFPVVWPKQLPGEGGGAKL